MANFLDEVNTCEHHTGRINQLSEENIFVDETRSSIPLLGNADEPATFCVRCRSMSSSSGYLTGHGTELSNSVGDTEWDNRTCNGHNDIVLNSSLAPQFLTDEADMPLLTDGEGFAVSPCSEDSYHCHVITTPHSNSKAWQQLVVATLMCLFCMIAEIVGGYLAGSLAVITDAAHLLTDFVGFGVSLFAIWLGERPPTTRLSFGYYRAEILGALLSIGMIWMMTTMFVYLAVVRLLHQDFTIKADRMMIVAAIGVVINILMGLVLHGVCHDISHNHSHGLTTKRERNINVRAAVIHVLGDLIQSVGVLVSAIVIKFYPSAKIVDPICTFLFSLVVLATTFPVLRDAAHVLMEGFPQHLDYAVIAKRLRALDGVHSIHNLHVWSLTLNKNALSVHIIVDEIAQTDVVLRQALRLVRRKFDIHHATIQVERYHAATMLH